MKANELKPGDVYSIKGRVCPPRRVRSIFKRGAFMLVAYDYRVLASRRTERITGSDTKWYRQAIPPIHRLHVNKVVEISK